MKITKKQLKRIVLEEKLKLLRETNRDGTISDDEDGERGDLLASVEVQMNELIQYVVDEAERIGGDFRSPGIKQQVWQLMADMVHSYKRGNRPGGY
jgi:hypothetical protein